MLYWTCGCPSVHTIPKEVETGYKCGGPCQEALADAPASSKSDAAPTFTPFGPDHVSVASDPEPEAIADVKPTPQAANAKTAKPTQTTPAQAQGE